MLSFRLEKLRRATTYYSNLRLSEPLADLRRPPSRVRCKRGKCPAGYESFTGDLNRLQLPVPDEVIDSLSSRTPFGRRLGDRQ